MYHRTLNCYTKECILYRLSKCDVSAKSHLLKPQQTYAHHTFC